MGCSMGFASKASGGKGGRGKSSRQQPITDVESFLDDGGVDEVAREQFRVCAPDVQEQIMRMGPLSTAKNPSGALMSRIKGHSNNSFALQVTEIQQSQKTDYEGGVEATKELVEQFLAESGTDESSSDVLRQQPPHVQQAVMGRGDLSNARNPSATLLHRIGEERKKRGVESVGDASKTNQAMIARLTQIRNDAGPEAIEEMKQLVDQFLMENAIDDAAGQMLKNSSMEVQNAVMYRGELLTAKNPSAALQKRINEEIIRRQPNAWGGGGGMMNHMGQMGHMNQMGQMGHMSHMGHMGQQMGQMNGMQYNHMGGGMGGGMGGDMGCGMGGGMGMGNFGGCGGCSGMMQQKREFGGCGGQMMQPKRSKFT